MFPSWNETTYVETRKQQEEAGSQVRTRKSFGNLQSLPTFPADAGILP